MTIYQLLKDDKEVLKSTGVKVKRSFYPCGRELFDVKFCKKEKGWYRYNTKDDNSCFGVWINPTDKTITAYIEGDIVLTNCLSVSIFFEELKNLKEFHGSPLPEFV